MQDFFAGQQQALAPLADRMRPRSLSEFLGQEHLVGKGKLLRRAIEIDRLTSSIFYGPPGCGKTTLANIIAETTNAAFMRLNAVTSGVSDVREVIKAAEDRQKLYGQATYLLLDECHRWNKAQSDSILPAIEKGVIRFIGSTTENPMVAMTPAIVSRCRLFEFKRLGAADVIAAMERALGDVERGLGGYRARIEREALAHIARIADGDIRSALNAIELAVLTTEPGEDGTREITLAIAEDSIQAPVLRVDETQYYHMLSAFCKSLRGSDTDAAMAWFARLVHAGVDPRIIVRRLIAHASEDVGLANPNAMLTAVAAGQALEFIGMPEARLSIAQAIVTVCESPKSNASAVAMWEAFADAEVAQNAPVPIHLRDTNYGMDKRLGYGKGYLYDHDFPGHHVEQAHAPEDVQGKRYYRPSEQGSEVRIRQLRAIRGIVDPPETFPNGKR